MSAQNVDALNTYSPYSMYGIGDISNSGTSFNAGMGGIGIGVRDNKYINMLNPASITERDSLAFMFDIGMNQNNIYASTNKTSSPYNTFSLNNLMMTFPLYKQSAFIIGITPLSSTGYKFKNSETDPYLVSNFGDIEYEKYGEGSLYNLFLGIAANVTKNLSLAIQGEYYFGSIDQHSDVLFNSSSVNKDILTGWDYQLHGMSAKLGLQYEKSLSNNKDLVFGATYRFGTNLSGHVKRYNFSESSSGTTDTLYFNENSNPSINVASQLGLGMSYRVHNKFMIGGDYLYSSWSNDDFPVYSNIDYNISNSQSVKLGLEYTPNKYDIRYYYKRVSYRMGAYFDKSYLTINNQNINSFGVTFGTSLPINKYYNAISFSVDLGQRGLRTNDLIRERYIKFKINVNLFDIWFLKYKYE